MNLRPRQEEQAEDRAVSEWGQRALLARNRGEDRVDIVLRDVTRPGQGSGVGCGGQKDLPRRSLWSESTLVFAHNLSLRKSPPR